MKGFTARLLTKDFSGCRKARPYPGQFRFTKVRPKMIVLRRQRDRDSSLGAAVQRAGGSADGDIDVGRFAAVLGQAMVERTLGFVKINDFPFAKAGLVTDAATGDRHDQQRAMSGLAV